MENSVEIAFPTESKIRAKGEPTKRKKRVEAHYDDLGDYLSGLGGDLAYMAADYFPE